jgi:mitochondrial enoyl-[acyl-carrier protein] reductase / trans-2-enoyl-CoA reductase
MAKKPVTVPASLFIFKNISCHGFWVSVWSDLYPQEKEEMVNEIFELYKSGQFKDVPIEKAIWKDDSEQSELIKAIEKSQTGFGGKKQVFVFETK